MVPVTQTADGATTPRDPKTVAVLESFGAGSAEPSGGVASSPVHAAADTLPDRDTLLFSVAKRAPEGSCTRDLDHLLRSVPDIDIPGNPGARSQIIQGNPCETFETHFRAGLTPEEIRDRLEMDVRGLRAYLAELEPAVLGAQVVLLGPTHTVEDLERCARGTAACPAGMTGTMQQASLAYVVTIWGLMVYEEHIVQITTYLR